MHDFDVNIYIIIMHVLHLICVYYGRMLTGLQQLHSTLLLNQMTNRQHSLLQSFLHKDQGFYCMTEQQEAPCHVWQTISQMMHHCQGFHLQIPEVHQSVFFCWGGYIKELNLQNEL